ncbi:MAG: hypothetical protein WB562_19775, partial [Candidatus Sulfotelmatobacter sp.]
MNMMDYFSLKKAVGGEDDSDDSDNSNSYNSYSDPNQTDEVDEKLDPNALPNLSNDAGPDSTDFNASLGNKSPSSRIDVNARMAQLYQPKSDASKAYMDAMNNMPDRSAYAPSMGRNILAAIAGLGAAHPMGIAHGQPVGFEIDPNRQTQTMNAITDQPYNQALGDWSNKLKPLGVAATQEEKDNQNMRIAANNTLAREISAQGADTRAKNEQSL